MILKHHLLLRLSTGLLALIFLAFWLSGCGKPPSLVQKYVLEYPSPQVTGKNKVTEAIRVERFAVAQAYRTEAMIYRPSSYQSEAYTYHRWRVNPGDLVTDYLMRDLRNSRLFKAVFPPSSSGDSRFLLEGAVEEFQEIDAPEGWRAALAFSITLLDQNQEDITRKVVFQKNYRLEEPMPEKNPQGLAQGMSLAMEQLSGQAISDIYRAAQQRVAASEKK